MNPTGKEGTGGQQPMATEESETLEAGAADGAENLAGSPEQSDSAAETSLAPAAPPLAAMPAPSLPLPVPTTTTPTPAASTTPATTLTADDNKDLIEKEWVDKAKQIVEQTRNDPYKQSEELTLFKADYMKKRYGKTIKVSQ